MTRLRVLSRSRSSCLQKDNNLTYYPQSKKMWKDGLERKGGMEGGRGTARSCLEAYDALSVSEAQVQC